MECGINENENGEFHTSVTFGFFFYILMKSDSEVKHLLNKGAHMHDYIIAFLAPSMGNIYRAFHNVPWDYKNSL